MTDKEKILNEIERLINNHDSALDYEAALEDVRNFIDSMDEEPVGGELEKASDQYSQSIHSDYSNDMFDRGDIYEAVIYGAEWQKEQMKEALRTEYEKGRHNALEEMKKEE